MDTEIHNQLVVVGTYIDVVVVADIVVVDEFVAVVVEVPQFDQLAAGDTADQARDSFVHSPFVQLVPRPSSSVVDCYSWLHSHITLSRTEHDETVPGQAAVKMNWRSASQLLAADNDVLVTRDVVRELVGDCLDPFFLIKYNLTNHVQIDDSLG